MRLTFGVWILKSLYRRMLGYLWSLVKYKLSNVDVAIRLALLVLSKAIKYWCCTTPVIQNEEELIIFTIPLAIHQNKTWSHEANHCWIRLDLDSLNQCCHIRPTNIFRKESLQGLLRKWELRHVKCLNSDHMSCFPPLLLVSSFVPRKHVWHHS